jgi:uncharacterized cupredoxin-like copper-binding protein
VDSIIKGGVMIAWRRALLWLVPFALLSVACGESNDGESTQIDVTLDDFMFSPIEWTVAAGEEVTVELENTGSVLHEFVILQSGVDISSESDLPTTDEDLADLVYWETGWIKPGQSTTETFTAPEAGIYQVICEITTHFNAGMTGTLTVEAP